MDKDPIDFEDLAEIAERAPGLGTAIKLSKVVMYPFVRERVRREKRAREWLQMFVDDPGMISEDLWASPYFQDGFMYMFQVCLRTRSSKKRENIRSLLRGFAKNGDLEQYPYERLISCLEQIRPDEVLMLSIYSNGSLAQWLNEQSMFDPEKDDLNQVVANESLNVLQIGQLILADICGHEQFRDSSYTHEVIASLVGLGLIRTGFYRSTIPDAYQLTSLGQEFIKYLAE